MTDFYNYKTALLYLFIRCMGDGFYGEMCKYGNIQDSSLKHKISEMKKGDKSAYREISIILQNCIKAFTEGEISDKETIFCQKNASDKYYFTFGAFFDKFKWACNENEPFFYEDFSDALSYIISREFYIDLNEYKFPENPHELDLFEKTNDFLKDSDLEEYEAKKKDVSRAFRPEYQNAVFEVRRNAKTTFYKWCIDEFYQQVASKNKADEIIKVVFGKNEDDDSISTTFEKLKYENGKREWKTFRHLFQNELNDSELMDLLSDEEILEKYQIFQSRMSAAFFLENLCAELSKIVDDSQKSNSSEIRKILIFDKSCKKPEDFLVPNHKEKTESYKEKVIELLSEENSYEWLSEKAETLDKNCPATETIKSYLSLLNGGFYFYLEKGVIPADTFLKYFEVCKKNPRYLEFFSDMGIKISCGDYSISSDLNNFLWKHEEPALN